MKTEDGMAKLRKESRTLKTQKIFNNWPDPTEDMLKTPEFEAVWKAIKSWDINVPKAYNGYCGATGNHVRAILDSIHESKTPEKLSYRLYDSTLQQLLELLHKAYYPKIYLGKEWLEEAMEILNNLQKSKGE